MTSIQQTTEPFKFGWVGKFIDLDGVRLHYMERGKGDPVLMVHGLGAYSYTWRHNMDALAQQFRVIAIDLKGFGLSEKPIGPGYSIESHVHTILQFISKLQLPQINYVGSSMGGEIGLRLCLVKPEQIKKLILIGSSGYRDKLPYSIRLLAHLPYKYFVRPLIKRKYLTDEALFQFVKSAFYNPEAITEEEIRQYLYPVSTQGFEQSYITLLKEFDFGKRQQEYELIPHQALILTGEKDLVIPHEHSVKLHHALKNSSLITISKCGHFLHEEKPEETNQFMLDFLIQS